MGALSKDRRLEGWAQALLALTSLFLLAPFAVAQPTTPVINTGGLINAASFLAAEISSGAIAQGSIFSLFGSDFSAETTAAEGFPIPRNLGGVEVEVVAGGNTATIVGGGDSLEHQATLQVPSWSISTNDLSEQTNPRDDGLRFEWEGLFFTLASASTRTGPPHLHQRSAPLHRRIEHIQLHDRSRAAGTSPRTAGLVLRVHGVCPD